MLFTAYLTKLLRNTLIGQARSSIINSSIRFLLFETCRKGKPLCRHSILSRVVRRHWENVGNGMWQMDSQFEFWKIHDFLSCLLSKDDLIFYVAGIVPVSIMSYFTVQNCIWGIINFPNCKFANHPYLTLVLIFRPPAQF